MGFYWKIEYGRWGIGERWPRFAEAMQGCKGQAGGWDMKYGREWGQD